MQTVSLKVEKLDGPEIIIREGKALELKPPEKIRLSGDIKTITKYLSIPRTGLQQVFESRAIVTVDKKAGTINLVLDPENCYSPDITGTLELSDELVKWFINAGKTFKLKELTNLIRFNKIDFDDADKHELLLKAYQTFNFTSYIQTAQDNDNRGNKKQSFEKEVKTGLPVDFVLNIPVFKGFDAMRFHVEICLETTEGAANFWLESVELHTLIETNKTIIFNEQLEACKGFVIINQ